MCSGGEPKVQAKLPLKSYSKNRQLDLNFEPTILTSLDSQKQHKRTVSVT